MSTTVRCEVGVPSADLSRPRSLSTTILRLIWDEELISRAEIARRLDVSRSTVSEIVDGLIETRLIAEAGVGASNGGRRPIVLSFQDEAFTLMGVDVGASHVSVVVTDLRGHVRAWQRRPFDVHADADGTRALVQSLCDACLSSIDLSATPLLGIGMALPSPVDPLHPERVSRIALKRWNGVHGFEMLCERYSVPLLIDNDANLGALAEHWWGAARGLSNFTFIKIATGIGAGHFIDGRIYRGAGGVAGEIGHVTVDVHGNPCACGNRGCLTTYVGRPEMLSHARSLLPEYPDSLLQRGEVTMSSLEAAANASDALASRVVQEAAEHLGSVVASLLNLMNPSAVILGGSLCRLRERVLIPVREAVMRRTFVSAVASSEILTSALGDRAIAIGAATLVLDAVLSDPRARMPVPSSL
ncbi:ROK family transcriptional regulator [Gemmatimonas phototrophica]|uniref:Uncharacterized protein n=1 Tax=Gemmatimonas phototrophica TaxID=1379270 RepID=A0A143BLU2_9BACT|nr:ROK family transcriptional regulator [Gemmatimonas phototrophica]AMW05424.1 hypothetical protein GEMMAAP_12680 [Gemmatimonas phototrophica]